MKSSRPSPLSLAFEITLDDVAVVLSRNSAAVKTSKSASEIFDEVVSPQSDRIAKAALRGDDLDDQTDGAHKEIERVLRENGVLA